jgi:ribonuclease VapC
VIVDTSAIVAIINGEPEAAAFVAALTGATAVRMSAASYVEAGAVIDSRGDPVLSRQFDDLMTAAAIGIAPVDREQALVARTAYRDFGRGSGHPARLNYGDCFSYALARVTGEPLLFKGADFGQTDLVAAR